MRGKGRPRATGTGRSPRRLSRIACLAAAALAGACQHQAGADRQATQAAAIRSQQARDLARQAGLAPAVQDFLARAAGVGAASFTVLYDLGQGRRSVVAQRPPNRRVDIQGASSPSSLDRYLVTAAGTYNCHRDQGPWTCQRGGDAPAIGAFSADTIGQTVAALAESTTAYDFVLQPRRIAGVTASCLLTTLKADHPADPSLGVRGMLCIAPSGTILAIEGTSNAVTAITYAGSVDGGAFTLPAKPAPAPQG